MKTLELLVSTVILFACIYDLSAVDEEWPILAFESGSVAHIPCMVRGETKAYFWKKGSVYNMSEHVAANVHGQPDKFANDTQGKLTVTEDGTLIIYDISPDDDDTYFCRVVSQSSEHYGGVVVYSQASFASVLSIDHCAPDSSCKLFLEPFSKHRLTCTASYVSSMVDVRWIDNNGTVIDSSLVKYINVDGSYNISKRTEIVYNAPTLLFCEVFSPAIKGEFIHVQLETVQELEEQNDGYFVAFLVTLVVAITIILTISAVCKRIASKGKGKGKGSIEEEIPLQGDVPVVAELKDKIKDLSLELELARRKYRAQLSILKDKHKIFLRPKPQENNSNAPINSDKLKEWVDRYNFTKIFPQDASQETLFKDTETPELIQESVDGEKACIVAFGGPHSGRTYTMKGPNKQLKIEPPVGLIPRTVHRVFELVDDLKKKHIQVKVTASRVKNYQRTDGVVVTFIELKNLSQEKNSFYKVQGLDVAKKVYNVSNSKEVLDLLWEEPTNEEKEDGREKNGDGGEKKEDGGEKNEDGGEKNEDGGEKNEDGGEKNEDGGEKKEDGGEKKEDGGEKKEDGGEKKEDGRKKKEDGRETCDLLQIYIETFKGSKLLSKGILSLAILSAEEASRQFSGQQTGNRSIGPLLEPFLKDDKCHINIIANVALDNPEDAFKTLNAVKKMKLERTKTPKKAVDKS